MTCRGIVKHGKIEVEQKMSLPDGTAVRIEAEQQADWRSQWEAFAQQVDREWKSPLSALAALRESRR